MSFPTWPAASSSFFFFLFLNQEQRSQLISTQYRFVLRKLPDSDRAHLLLQAESSLSLAAHPYIEIDRQPKQALAVTTCKAAGRNKADRDVCFSRTSTRGQLLAQKLRHCRFRQRMMERLHSHTYTRPTYIDRQHPLSFFLLFFLLLERLLLLL